MKKNLIVAILCFCYAGSIFCQQERNGILGKDNSEINVWKQKYDLLFAQFTDTVSMITVLRSDNEQFQRNSDKINAQARQNKKDTVGLSRLKVLKDSVKIMENSVKTKNENISAIHNKNISLEVKTNDLKGRLDKCSSKLSEKYSISFEESLKLPFSVETLESDLSILNALKESDILKNKVNDLLIFKKAECLLNSRFDSKNTNKERDNLKQIFHYNQAKMLDSLLNNYEANSKYLKKMIVGIQNDNKDKPTIPALITKKKAETLMSIQDYLIDYEIDLFKYQYLNNIITEIKKKKFDDVNADLKEFLERL